MGSLKQRLASKGSALKRQEPGELRQVGVDNISPNPEQPRQIFDEQALKELTESVKQLGVIQPVIIQRSGNDLILVAGERRLRAAKAAGLKEIPAILTDQNPVEVALIENLQRENLKPLEEAEALQKMVTEYNYTQETLAKVIGKGRSTVTEILSLNRLPDEIKDECRPADNISRKHLIQIVRQKTPEAMMALFQKMKDENLSSNQVKDFARKKAAKPAKPRKTQITMARETFKKQSGYIGKLVEKKKISPSDTQGLKELMGEWNSLQDLMKQLSKKLKDADIEI